MPTGKITKRTVDALTPAERDVFLWDTELRGFGLKVTPAGARRFLYQYRLGGRGTKTQRWTIGSYGAPWTPDAARTEAGRLAGLVDQGVDPLHERRERERKAATMQFAGYVETFTDGYLKPDWGTSWPQAKRQLEMHAVPLLGQKNLPDIALADLNAVLDALRDRPALRRNVYAVLSKLFRWAARRGDIDDNLFLRIDAPPMVKQRKRVLSPVELAAVWQAAFALDHPRGPLVRLLLITMQRRSEVAGLRWEELSQQDRAWILPGERAKNGHDHLVPLSALAMAELDVLGWKSAGLVLPSSTGKTPVSNFSDMKAVLDVGVTKALEGSEPAPWRLHDLRRSGATNLQALGFPIEVGERVLNHHQGGTLAGIRAVYALHEYADEKRLALDAWSARLNSIVTGEQPVSNVVPLARASADMRGG